MVSLGIVGTEERGKRVEVCPWSRSEAGSPSGEGPCPGRGLSMCAVSLVMPAARPLAQLAVHGLGIKEGARLFSFSSRN